MYKIYRGISHRFMQDLVEEFDTKYHTRSRYEVELDDEDNVKNFNKRLNYRSQKPNQHKFIWTRIFSMART